MLSFQPWASLVAQMVKNPPAMWETWAWSLGWEDPLGKGTATCFSILSSVQFIRSVMSDSLQPHGLQHARLPCPTTPGPYSNSCQLSRWCHPTISSSVVPFSSCLQSFSIKVFSSESSILPWRIPRTEESGRLQYVGSQRVGHAWVTFTLLLQLLVGLSCISLVSPIFNSKIAL